MSAAVKNPVCPICQETFKDGRGLSGHLQFKHGLSGEDHEEKLEEGMSRGTEEVPTSGFASVDRKLYQDDRMQAVENLRVAKKRLERAKERKEALHEASGGHTEFTGWAASTWQQVKGETREQIDDQITRCEEEIEKRKEQLDDAIQAEVDRRE